jgi:hypothetical protein
MVSKRWEKRSEPRVEKGAACCQPAGLATYKAAPLPDVGRCRRFQLWTPNF